MMTEGQPYFRTPALSPDGRLLAFVYAADIWLVDAQGGSAERLTAHPAGHSSPRFSPDGTQLAFSSTRTGGGDVYVLPLEGGEIRRLTYHSSYCHVEDWAGDGQHIYFVSGHDQQGQAIYRVPLAGGTPALLYAEPYSSLGHASVSPDAHDLLFNTIRGRWWRRGPDPFSPTEILLASALPAAGDPADHLPRKLVGIDSPHAYSGLNRWPLWAPDGAGIYFVSDRGEGSIENLWYQSREADELRQITHFRDGRLLWPGTARQAGMIVFERDGQIWRLDPTSGEAEPVPIRVRADTKLTPVYVEMRTRGYSELRLSPDGKKVAFVARGEIFADFSDKETDKEQRQGPSFRVTETHARESQITWTPDSRSLLYVSDRHGEPEIYRYDFTTRSETRLTDDPAPKGQPCCSPDGTWVAYLYGLDDIHLLNLKTGESRPFARGSFIWNDALAWSPDSRWLAYISHDDRLFANVYVQHIDETEAHQISFLSNISGDNLLWSPDGKFLIFSSGQYRLESQIVRIDLRPPLPTFRENAFEKLFEEKKDKHQKPDGDRQAAPARDDKAAEPEQPEDQPEEPPGDEAAPPEGEQPEDQPEEPPGDEAAPPEDEQPAEEPQEQPEDDKDESAAPQVEIVFEGIERRLSFLTPIQMDADAQAISRNSRDLLFVAVVAGKVNIWTLPLDEPRQGNPPQQVTSNSSSKRHVQFVPSGKALFYLEDGQITIRKFPYGSDPLFLQTRCEVNVDFNQEKHQIFGEAWRLLRDLFYDQTFRGQDWHALREHFLPLVNGAQSHGELMHVLNLMIGELRASHTGVYWYSGRGGSDGYTGLLFDPLEQVERGLLRVAALVPDSPAALLDEPPRVGEYLLAVNGVALTPQTSLDELLQRTVGRRVILRLAATPAGESAREVAIRPINGDAYEHLRYRAWVTSNKAYVHRVSEGRLGYVHIEEMSYRAYQQFLVDLDTETHSKAGVILDVRHNGGGHISTFILDVLARRSVLRSGFRNHNLSNPYHIAGNRALNKPTVLVTNESSASDAEIFTEIYRRMGLGKVVGRPTAGRVIGTINRPLLNGSYLRLPIYAYSTPEGEDLEGTGRTVDIEATLPVGEWAAGRDRQLDAAIAALLET
jgi:Tol biopolymer transport system component/C-terminal processing protease CtpA/Prc